MVEIMSGKMLVRNEIRAYIVLIFIVQLYLLCCVCISKCLVGAEKDEESWNSPCQDRDEGGDVDGSWERSVSGQTIWLGEGEGVWYDASGPGDHSQVVRVEVGCPEAKVLTRRSMTQDTGQKALCRPMKEFYKVLHS